MYQTLSFVSFLLHNVNWLNKKKGRMKMLYITTHSTHFIYGYMASEFSGKICSKMRSKGHQEMFISSSRRSSRGFIIIYYYYYIRSYISSFKNFGN